MKHTNTGPLTTEAQAMAAQIMASVKPAIQTISLADLKRDHPGVYAECVVIGAQQERKRILAAMPTAPGQSEWARYTHDCIKNGTPMNDLAKARHAAFAMDSARRQAASEDVAGLVLKRMGVGL